MPTRVVKGAYPIFLIAGNNNCLVANSGQPVVALVRDAICATDIEPLAIPDFIEFFLKDRWV